MSHLVSSVAPIAGAHTVKFYAGFGILGANIPATGDHGGSPVLNDGINPAAEYHWRIETPPDSGTLTIYPDLSYEHSGASDGLHPWVYRLFEFGVSQGTATVNDQFGVVTQLLMPASSQQANQATAVSIQQTHLLEIAGAQQANQVSAIIASQSSITFLSAADSQQAGQVSAGVIGQTHQLGIAPCQQGSIVIPVAIQPLAVGGLQIAPAQQAAQLSAASIGQAHLLGIAACQQALRLSSIPVSDGDAPPVTLNHNPRYIIKRAARRFIF